MAESPVVSVIVVDPEQKPGGFYVIRFGHKDDAGKYCYARTITACQCDLQAEAVGLFGQAIGITLALQASEATDGIIELLRRPDMDVESPSFDEMAKIISDHDHDWVFRGWTLVLSQRYAKGRLLP